MMKLCSLLLRARRRPFLLFSPDGAANGEAATATERWAISLFVSLLFLTVLTCPLAYAQGTHIIVGQTGVNPGAGLFTIAVKQGLYKKNGLDVEIIKTATTTAVQAMLAGKMHLATGAGAAALRLCGASGEMLTTDSPSATLHFGEIGRGKHVGLEIDDHRKWVAF